MIAVDTNILVYSHRADSEFHEAAVGVVKSLAEGNRQWAIPWPCIHEFLAVVTHPRIYAPPTPGESAVAQVEAWLDSPPVVVLGEGPGHWGRLAPMVVSGAVGPKVHDARVASMCLSGGVTELWSVDRDFSRFDLRVVNPLRG